MTVENEDGHFSLKRRFPALRLTEVPGNSLSLSSIFFAGVASVLIGLLGWLINFVLPIEKPHLVPQIFPSAIYFPGAMGMDRYGAPIGALGVETGPLRSLITLVTAILSPSAGTLLWLNALVMFLIELGIWSIIGTYLCRRSAHHFAGDDEKTVSSAINYSLKRWLVSFGSPLIPLLTALFVASIAAVIGFLGRIPYVGPPGLYVISPMLLVMGVMMAFLVLATMLSWPLMIAAIAIDDCDSFGGLSRAYSGLTGRPWYLAGYISISLFLGYLLLVMLKFFLGFSIWCAFSSLDMGGVSTETRKLLYPALFSMVQFMMSVIGTSYFWSAATMIYLLIRQDVDGVPMDQIALDDTDRPVHEPLPVVGIPATDASFDSNGHMSLENPTDVL